MFKFKIYKTFFDLIERTKRKVHKHHICLYNNIALEKNIFISEKAIIRTSYAGECKEGLITIGQASSIHDFCHLYAGKGFIKIGSNCSINPFCLLDGYGGITIGNNVRIANHTTIVSANHNFLDKQKLIRQQGITGKGITIEDDVWIGAGARIMDGITIQKGAVIGAGSVVTKNIKSYSVVVGVPAKTIKMRT